MAARTRNGNKFRDQIYKEMEYHISALLAGGIRPGLATVLAGENPASKMYVASKIAACELLRLKSWNDTPVATSSTNDLLTLLETLNKNSQIDGTLIQLPPPPQVDSK